MSAHRPPEPACKQLFKWLRLNLGRERLAALTGTDTRALGAVAHILSGGANVEGLPLEAFRAMVLVMQPRTRELAYHAVACFGEWEWRARVWAAAKLPPLERVSVCVGEPEGRARGLEPFA